MQKLIVCAQSVSASSVTEHGQRTTPERKLVMMISLAIGLSAVQSAQMRAQLLRLICFCAVGLTCFALGLAILAGMHELAGINYLIAFIVSFVVTSVTGYLLNARFTFSLAAVTHRGAIRYMTVNAALLCANTLALKLLVDTFHMWYLAAAVLLAIINTPVSFVGQWLYTYRIATRDSTAAT